MPSIDEFQSQLNGLREGIKNSLNLSRASIKNLLKENLFYINGYVIGLQDSVYQSIWLDILQGWNEALKDIKNNQLPPPAELGSRKNYSPAQTLGYLRCCGVSYSEHPHYQEQLQALALQASQSALPKEISAPLLTPTIAPILDSTAESTSLNQENVELLLAGNSDAKSHNQPLPLSQLFDGRSCYYIQGYISGLSNIKFNRIWELYLSGWISAANDIAASQQEDLLNLYSRKTEDNISYILGYYDYCGYSVTDSRYLQLLTDLNSQQTVYGQGMRAAMQWSTISIRPAIPPASAVISTASSSHIPATSINTAALADAAETSGSTEKRKISKDTKAGAQSKASNEKLIQKRKKILSDITMPQFITEEMGMLFLQRCDTARVRVYEDLHGKKIDVSSTPLKSKKAIHELASEINKGLEDLNRPQGYLIEEQLSSRKNKLSLKMIASFAYYLAYHGRNYRGDTLSGAEVLSMISKECEKEKINSLQELIKHIAAGNMPCFYKAESPEKQPAQEARIRIQPISPPASSCSSTSSSSYKRLASALNYASEASGDPTKKRKTAADTNNTKALHSLLFIDGQAAANRSSEKVIKKRKEALEGIILPPFINQEMAIEFLQKFHSGRSRAYDAIRGAEKPETGIAPRWRGLWKANAIHDLAAELNKKLEELYDSSLDYFTERDFPARHNDLLTESMRRLAYYLGYHGRNDHGKPFGNSEIISILVRECKTGNIDSVQALIRHVAAGRMPSFYKTEPIEKAPEPEKEPLQNLMAP
ncbi:hypothetical protein Lqui_2391 [Legionella quinlivanii]|uniref:Uncharacterized protein n=1 Tax=Legionella quinlivanii TaxID=45073 RepID=A0A0W0XSI2_9GAMM|nr:hypothetical protein [Legionella quinlivanii]KTD47465.1 hypothetical protein Lqui_2391 [Legionella quinlivanii]SEG39555.1 hypothetical protein SAMN02746093_02795 [Legionella quinlivanii DSM 21216]STY09953.1 Uncharacterised protein [Legionella quinlivanii]